MTKQNFLIHVKIITEKILKKEEILASLLYSNEKFLSRKKPVLARHKFWDI